MKRRDLLLLGLGAGCSFFAKPPPRVAHPAYPIGLIPRSSGRGLACGAASIDLTPPPGSTVWLAGYGFQRKMERVRDPISARCLYFDDGRHRVALVIADVVGLLHPTVERVRRLVGNGIEVVVASTHNHQGPDTMGYWGEAILYAFPIQSGVDPHYQRVLERRLAASVKLAAERAQPVRLWFGRSEIPDGVVRNLRTPGIYDRAIEVMEARTRSGRSVATFVNFACHPETLGETGRLLSADFPGLVRAKVEGARGGTEVIANGALGGMVTADLDRTTELSDRLVFLEQMGERLSEATLHAIESAIPFDVREIGWRSTPIELANTNEMFPVLERIGLIEPHQRGNQGGFVTEVGRIDLGPAKWAIVPGEATPMVGLRIKEMLKQRGATHPAVIGLGNDELGYILDPSQYDDPEFAYEVSVSVGRDTAATIEAALASL